VAGAGAGRGAGGLVSPANSIFSPPSAKYAPPHARQLFFTFNYPYEHTAKKKSEISGDNSDIDKFSLRMHL
jgi:hypothetical protein